MSKILKFNIVFLFLLMQSIFCEAQNLHKTSKDLPQVNKEFQLHFFVSVDSLRQMNFTQADMQGAIDQANRLFAPIAVSFSICGWDTIPDYTFDLQIEPWENGEMSRLWIAQRKINIYVLELLQDDPDLCGYAGGPRVVLKKGCQSSLTHELGHSFGLPHTFSGGEELVDGSNCETAGDGFCDTPADPFVVGAEIEWTSGCEFIYEGTDANGQFYQPDVGNVMSYYGCSCGFTHGQYVRMAETIFSSFNRTW